MRVLSRAFMEYHCKLTKPIVPSIARMVITTISSTRVKACFLKKDIKKDYSYSCIYNLFFLFCEFIRFTFLSILLFLSYLICFFLKYSHIIMHIRHYFFCFFFIEFKFFVGIGFVSFKNFLKASFYFCDECSLTS